MSIYGPLSFAVLFDKFIADLIWCMFDHLMTFTSIWFSSGYLLVANIRKKFETSDHYQALMRVFVMPPPGIKTSSDKSSKKPLC